MAASLGSTSDPKEFVPGDTGKLGDLETALTTWSTMFEGTGDGLCGQRVKGRVGKVGDAFWPTLGKEKTNWYFAGDAMSSAAEAVHSYTSTLHWAQGQAATAIDKWGRDCPLTPQGQPGVPPGALARRPDSGVGISDGSAACEAQSSCFAMASERELSTVIKSRPVAFAEICPGALVRLARM